jgi:hypothetical protein
MARSDSRCMVLGCALVWIVATVSVLAVDRKPGPDKRSIRQAAIAAEAGAVSGLEPRRRLLVAVLWPSTKKPFTFPPPCK